MSLAVCCVRTGADYAHSKYPVQALIANCTLQQDRNALLGHMCDGPFRRDNPVLLALAITLGAVFRNWAKV